VTFRVAGIARQTATTSIAAPTKKGERGPTELNTNPPSAGAVPRAKALID
jgi:hypothetical protein